MAISTKVNGRIINNTVKDDVYIETETYMKAIGGKVRPMVRASISIRMGQYIKVSGWIMFRRGREASILMMGLCLRGCILMG